MTEESDPADNGPSNRRSGNRRSEPRTGVLKGVKILFGTSVIDCLVLDVSPSGARIRVNEEVTIPEHVTLQFSGGSVFRAQGRWARGKEIGFQFDMAAPLGDDQAASVALSAFNALLANDPETPIQTLRAAKFFDDPALAKVAEEAEAAFARLKTALKARIKF